MVHVVRSTGLILAFAIVLAPLYARADVQHVVAKGHTLQAIANRYHVSVRAILDRNNLADGKHLHPGDVLVIPVGPAAGAGAPHVAHGGRVARMVAPSAAAPGGVHGVALAQTPGMPPQAGSEHVALGDPNALPVGGHGNRLHPGSMQHASIAAVANARHGLNAHAVTPGLVHVHRLATQEESEIRVGLRGHTPAEAAKKFQHMMRSPGGPDHPIDPRLVALVGIVSDHFGSRKIEVISGFRPFTPKQYTPHSNHNHGKAIDFRVVGVANESVRDFCRTLRNTGCGYYPNSVFVHMDVRGSSAYWIDYSKAGEAPRYQGPNVEADEGTADVAADDTTLDSAAVGTNAVPPSEPASTTPVTAPMPDAPAESVHP